jgi:hypothetical protein
LLALLFGACCILRIKFPNASGTAETKVLVVVTILFFSIGSMFLGSEKPLSKRLAAPQPLVRIGLLDTISSEVDKFAVLVSTFFAVAGSMTRDTSRPSRLTAACNTEAWIY